MPRGDAGEIQARWRRGTGEIQRRSRLEVVALCEEAALTCHHLVRVSVRARAKVRVRVRVRARVRVRDRDRVS